MNFTKQEMYLFGFLTLFAILWIGFLIPYLGNSTDFAKLNPIQQYILFNVGFIFLSIVLINVPFKILTHHKVKLVDMIKIGLAGWLLFSFIYDLWQPPNNISPEGKILITAQQSLPNTAVDAMLRYVWEGIIPHNAFIGGISLLYLAVYFISPIIAVLFMILLFKPSLIKKVILEK